MQSPVTGILIVGLYVVKQALLLSYLKFPPSPAVRTSVPYFLVSPAFICPPVEVSHVLYFSPRSCFTAETLPTTISFSADLPPQDALITTVPSLTPVTTPSATVATAVSFDSHTAVVSIVLASVLMYAGVTAAFKVIVAPTATASSPERVTEEMLFAKPFAYATSNVPRYIMPEKANVNVVFAEPV